MADTVKIEIELDPSNVNKSLDSVKSSVDQTGKSIQNSLGKSASESISRIGVAAAGVSAAIFTISKSIGAITDALKNVDKINQINAQFDLLAKNAGQSAVSLREAFESAGAGLVDQESILSAANKALIDLGSFANQLPKLFDIATKATKVFGGEAVDNFEAISRAVATGNAARLKSIGIIIDTQKAIDDYAKILGVSSKALSETGKQQAILNAILEKGETITAAANASVSQNDKAIKQLSVAYNSLKDAASVAIDSIFGSSFRAILSGATSALQFFSQSLQNVFASPGLEKQKKDLESLIAAQKFFLKENKEWLERSRQIKGVENNIASLEEKLKSLNQKIKETQDLQKKPQDAPALNLIDKNAINQQRTEFESSLIGIRNARISAETQNIALIQDAALKEQEIERLKVESILAIQEEFDAKESDLRTKANAARLSNDSSFLDSLTELQKLRAQSLLSALEQFNKLSSESILKTEEFFKRAIVDGLVKAFSALGGALARGKNGFEAFSDAVIKSIGALAIQIGSLLLLIGFGFKSVGIVFPAFLTAGAGAIVNGLALIALGGALQAVGGGGESQALATAGSPPTIAAPEVPTLDENAVDESRKSRVTINIQGDVLDSRDTGLRIVELLQDAFDTDGASVVTG